MKKILVSAFSLYLIACGSFFLFESDDLFAASVEDQITVTQSVTAEISITSPANVTMSPSLGGITGGTSNGYAQWTITTGASGGFTAALTATTTAAPFMYAMKGNVYGDWIDNYAGTTTIPTYLWNVVNAAEFGFTATTTTAADVGQSFKTAGAGLGPCNTGSNVLADTCWIGASTTAKQVMNRSTSAVSGTSLGVHFRVQINNHAVLEDTYVATTTITATTQ